MEDHSMENAGQKQTSVVPKPIVETDAQKVARLEKTVSDLKIIADSQPTISLADSKYMKDLSFFDKQKDGTNKIEMKDVTDHKNISLWTDWGKRIGPMHPTNARYTYNKFRKLGRILYTAKPSEAEIQAYYKTPQYIEWKKKHDELRIKRSKSKGKGELDKILAAMVSITGQTKDQLQSIIDKPVPTGAGG